MLNNCTSFSTLLDHPGKMACHKPLPQVLIRAITLTLALPPLFLCVWGACSLSISLSLSPSLSLSLSLSLGLSLSFSLSVCGCVCLSLASGMAVHGLAICFCRVADSTCLRSTSLPSRTWLWLPPSGHLWQRASGRPGERRSACDKPCSHRPR